MLFLRDYIRPLKQCNWGKKEQTLFNSVLSLIFIIKHSLFCPHIAYNAAVDYMRRVHYVLSLGSQTTCTIFMYDTSLESPIVYRYIGALYS